MKNEPTVDCETSSNEPTVNRENVTNEPTAPDENSTVEPTLAVAVGMNEKDAGDLHEEIDRQNAGEWNRTGLVRMMALREENLRELNERSRGEAKEANAIGRRSRLDWPNRNGKLADDTENHVERTEPPTMGPNETRKVGDSAELVRTGSGVTVAESDLPTRHARKSKMKIKIMKMIKRKSTIKSRNYSAALPLSYSRVELRLISPMSIRTIRCSRSFPGANLLQC